MRAGRELDALVAEHVMGWRCEEAASGDRWIDPVGGTHWTWTEASMLAGICFRPSTRIGNAWQVVGRMRELGWRVQIRATDAVEVIVSRGGPFVSPGPDYEAYEADEEDAPLAITLASLRALGVEIPEDG